MINTRVRCAPTFTILPSSTREPKTGCGSRSTKAITGRTSGSNQPPVSVQDIRIQPRVRRSDRRNARTRRVGLRRSDRRFKRFPKRSARDAMLFKPRDAYEYHDHSNGDFGTYTNFSASNPPSGVDRRLLPRRGAEEAAGDRDSRCFRHGDPPHRRHARSEEERGSPTFRTKPASIARHGISASTVRRSGWAPQRKSIAGPRPVRKCRRARIASA